jgi:hypothetical protein
VHGTGNSADLIRPPSTVCTGCHNPQSPNGPRGALEQHTHHAAASTGSQCVSCHMPSIAQTINTVNVRSHTFRFLSPTLTETNAVPNPCTTCHKDRAVEWAQEELRKWPEVSPWRVAP